MNLKVKTIIASLGMVSLLAAPALALTQYGNGASTNYEWDSELGNHEVGVRKSFGGSNTYGYSWVDPSNNDKLCYTQVSVGGNWSDEAYGRGYAQASQINSPGDKAVSEDHGRAY